MAWEESNTSGNNGVSYKLSSFSEITNNINLAGILHPKGITFICHALTLSGDSNPTAAALGDLFHSV